MKRKSHNRIAPRGRLDRLVLSLAEPGQAPSGWDRLEPTFLRSDPIEPWLIWQLADSAFPAGGFAHSGGLEAAWQQEEVRTAEELLEFVRAQLAQASRAMLPFVNEAYHQARSFAELDGHCDAFLSNHVANRGSRAQGQAFLLAAVHSFERAGLEQFRASVLEGRLPGHLAPVFGAVLRQLKVPHPYCVRLFLFLNLRALVAAAVRLGLVGPMAAQALQGRLAREAEAAAVQGAELALDQATQTSPLLDLLQGAHDRLYSRLFQT